MNPLVPSGLDVFLSVLVIAAPIVVFLAVVGAIVFLVIRSKRERAAAQEGPEAPPGS